MGKATKAADAEHELVGSVAAARHRTPVAALGAASEVADQPPLVAISLITLGTGLVLREPKVTRTGARMLLAHAIATGAKTIVKKSIDRTRPGRALKDGRHRAKAAEGASDTDFNSFPSGHTAGAVGVAQAIAHETPQFAGPARSWAAGIAAAQLPRGAHYPSDVLVGAAIGWTADAVAGAALHFAERAILSALGNRADQRAIAEAEAHPS